VLNEGEVLHIPSHWFHYIISLQKSAQCNVRSGRDVEGSKEFGGLNDVEECVDIDDDNSNNNHDGKAIHEINIEENICMIERIFIIIIINLCLYLCVHWKVLFVVESMHTSKSKTNYLQN